jgi:hypothetical protein
MHALLELQRAFGAALVQPGGTAPAAPLCRGPQEQTAGRLAVYRGNVYGNRARALAAAYPIVRKILGAAFFDAMAREYAQSHPAASGDLNEYGERFAEFVAAFPHTQDLPYLPDVARMEWLAHRAYYAADAAAFDPVHLAGVAPARYAGLHPALAPACALLESDWPLARIWTVHQDDYAGAIDVDLDAGPDRILVHRPLWRVRVLALGPGDYRLLDSALAGEQLGRAFEAACAEEPGFDLTTALRAWVEAGVIVDFAERGENSS